MSRVSKAIPKSLIKSFNSLQAPKHLQDAIKNDVLKESNLSQKLDKQYPKQIDNDLTQQQQKIFDHIISYINNILKNDLLKSNDPKDYMITLSGSAGTGKTFLVTKLIQYLHDQTDYTIRVTAPQIKL